MILVLSYALKQLRTGGISRSMAFPSVKALSLLHVQEYVDTSKVILIFFLLKITAFRH